LVYYYKKNKTELNSKIIKINIKSIKKNSEITILDSTHKLGP